MYVVKILFVSHQSHSKESATMAFIYDTIHYVYVCIHSTNELESSYGRSGGLICQWHFWCLKQFSSNLNDIRHTCSICNIDIGMTCITCEDQGFQSYDHLKKCFYPYWERCVPNSFHMFKDLWIICYDLRLRIKSILNSLESDGVVKGCSAIMQKFYPKWSLGIYFLNKYILHLHAVLRPVSS